MKCLLKNGKTFIKGELRNKDILIIDGKIAAISDAKSDSNYSSDVEVFNLSGKLVLPGLIDVHVHLREPGFLYKETIKTGSKAAARGGYTTVCAMPNVDPVPDCEENIRLQQQIIKKDAVIKVLPYASITRGRAGKELVDIDNLSKRAIAFSDDGSGIQSEELMREAMTRCSRRGCILAAHCEDESLINGGYIHDGEYARINGHRGISSASEWKQIERDLKLAKLTGVKYHVCHISTKESVDLIRKAKAEGVDVTCETAPHYLVLNDMMLQDEGRFKMNPPIRSEEDRLALIEGIKDGTIDMIATDHAPHSAEEKSKGLEGSNMGITGIETAFPVLYTNLVKPGIIDIGKLIEIMQKNPAKRFNIRQRLEYGWPANIAVFDIDNEYTINSEEFISKGKSTPFEGEKVFGKCIMTIANGKIEWEDKSVE